MTSLRERLDELRINGRHRPAAAAAPPRAKTLAEVLGGRAVRGVRGACWLVETSFDRVHGAPTVTGPDFTPAPRRVPHARPPFVVDPARAVVLDIETGGFSGAPVFLVGIVLPDRLPLCVIQLLARDYPEEAALLGELAALLADRDTWITFNGRAFDEPFLRDRATVLRVPLPRPTRHLDLLPAARRRWRGTLPDCRLVTLERHVLGRTRVGDVPSSDVPDLFHHFIRTGAAGPLRPVLEHNRLDLLTSVELLMRLTGPA